MYKIKDKWAKFDKRVSLIWETAKEGPEKIALCYEQSRNMVRFEFESKPFGGLDYALAYINTNLDNLPDYVSVNGIKSPLDFWFESA